MGIQNLIAEQKKTKEITVYRFDVFKGVADATGKIQKVKSVGVAYLREGLQTYTLHLKSFLDDTFYLLKNSKPTGADFVILTRELAKRGNRKYHWNNCGEGTVQKGSNSDLLKLDWDLFGEDIFMTVNPVHAQEIAVGPDFAAA
jgi:hypothetical protein